MLPSTPTPDFDPYRPPATPEVPEAGLPHAFFRNMLDEGTTETVGFPLRAVARCVDQLLGAVFAFGPAIWIAMAGSATHQTSSRLGFGCYASLFVYYVVSEGIGGATLGKLAFGLRVITTSDRAAGFGATVLRNLAFPVDGFLFGLVARYSMHESARNQRFGDRWANTVVVRARAVPQRARRNALVGALVGAVVTASLSAALTVAVERDTRASRYSIYP